MKVVDTKKILTYNGDSLDLDSLISLCLERKRLAEEFGHEDVRVVLEKKYDDYWSEYPDIQVCFQWTREATAEEKKAIEHREQQRQERQSRAEARLAATKNGHENAN